MSTKLHSVYFGDNPDDVANAAGAAPQAAATYDPGVLESGKTYYWRVDELDGAVTHTGDIWSFTTIPEIPIGDPNLLALYKLDEARGSTAVDWSGHQNHGTLIGTAGWTVPGLVGDSALHFGQNGYVAIRNLKYEGTAYGESSVCCWMRTENEGTQILVSFGQTDYWRLSIDSYGAGFGLIDYDVTTDRGLTELGSLTRVDDGFWHHICCVFDKGLLAIYIDGRLDATMTGGPTMGTGTTRYGFLGADSLADTYDGTRDRRAALMGDIDDVRIYDRALPAEEITQIMRGDPLAAWNPSPANGANADIGSALPLTWSAGDNAAQHDVYFGADIEAVKAADASDTTGIYRGRQNGTAFTPTEGVEWGGGPYYWRVDEVAADDTITRGGTWVFTVADFLLVDDIESYNDLNPDEPGTNRIFNTWIDGFGTTTNGALVGYDQAPFTERSIIHGGAQSMPYLYDTNLKISEATMTLVSPRDWTEQGVTKLSLWFRGQAANAPERIFVALNGSAVAYYGDPAATQTVLWTEWIIDLKEFSDQGVNLANVDTLTIGFGTKNSPAAGGTGTMYFDDIRLVR